MPSSLGDAVKGLLRKVAGEEKPERKKTVKKAAKKVSAKKEAKKTPKKEVKKALNKIPKKAPKKAAKKSPAKKSAEKQPAKPVPKKAAAKKTVKKAPAKKNIKAPAKKAVKIKAPAKKAVKKAAKPAPAAKKAPAKKAVKARSKSTQTNWSKRDLEVVAVQDQRDQPWVPERSKVKAAIENGLTDSYFSVQRVLYIGAAHGYTISQIAHKPLEIYAIEKSADMMRHFLPLAENLPSVLPVLGDAAYPDSYAHLIPQKVDVVFQDIAQKDQVGIFLSNCERFLAPHGVGMLAVKASSVESTAEPAAVFADTRRRLEEDGATIVQDISLEPYQKHHRLFVIHQNPYLDW